LRVLLLLYYRKDKVKTNSYFHHYPFKTPDYPGRINSFSVINVPFMKSVALAYARVIAMFCICSFSAPVLINAQLNLLPPVLTGHLSPIIDPDINGFYDYLPRNYSRDTDQKYPLLIFFHGYGDSGSLLDLSTLTNVLNAGTPQLLKAGRFPDSFNVAGKWMKFIVIVPQFKLGLFADNKTSMVKPSSVDALIDYALKTYRVDAGRVYLAGLSMGGGVAADYVASSTAAARRIAGVVVAAAASNVSESGADNIAAANVPFVATHNTVDELIPYGRTVSMMVKIRNSLRKQNKNENPSNLRAIYWESAGEGDFLVSEDKHNAWSRTFVDLQPGTSKGGNLADTMGTSVYNWLLQYSRTAESSLPLVWESFELLPANRSLSVEWSTSNEIRTKQFVVEKSSDGINWNSLATIPSKNQQDGRQFYQYSDAGFTGATTYYRIRQEDLDGRATYSVIKNIGSTVVANANAYPNPFVDRLEILIPPAVAAGVLNIRLFTLKGELIKSAQVKAEMSRSTNFTLQGLQSLNKGNYLLVVENEQKKVILSRKVLRN
jgi:predicted esterase